MLHAQTWLFAIDLRNLVSHPNVAPLRYNGATINLAFRM